MSEMIATASIRRRQQTARIGLYFLLILGAVLAMLPMVWMVSASLMPTGEASTYPPHFFPSRITFAHYTDLFTRLNLGRNLLNSAFLAFVVTFAIHRIVTPPGAALAFPHRVPLPWPARSGLEISPSACSTFPSR